MQYPIIDNLIYAYLRNGWTGLDLQYGKNIFDESQLLLAYGWQYSDGVYFGERRYFSVEFINGFSTPTFEENTQYTMSGYAWGSQASSYASIIFNYTDGTTERIQIVVVERTYFTFTSAENKTISYISGSFGSNGQIILYMSEIQLEKGTEATPYDPYSPPTTDIKNRLKIPIIHYFPHPVIDALISASDGQQTEEENEILRHYLTPLGIGGI